MKKILFTLFFFCLLFSLLGCEPKQPEITLEDWSTSGFIPQSDVDVFDKYAYWFKLKSEKKLTDYYHTLNLVITFILNDSTILRTNTKYENVSFNKLKEFYVGIVIQNDDDNSVLFNKLDKVIDIKVDAKIEGKDTYNNRYPSIFSKIDYKKLNFYYSDFDYFSVNLHDDNYPKPSLLVGKKDNQEKFISFLSESLTGGVLDGDVYYYANSYEFDNTYLISYKICDLHQ